MVSARHLLPLALTLALLLLAACGDSTAPAQPAAVTAPPSTTELADYLAAELMRLGRDPARTTAVAPSGERNSVFDLSAVAVDPDGEGPEPVAVELHWTEQLAGDYNMDGVVSLADITAVAQNWQQSIAYRDPAAADGISHWPTGEPEGAGAGNWRLARVDGSADGVVSLSDITTIAQQWQTRLDGYRVFRRNLGGSSSFTELPHPVETGAGAAVLRAEAQAVPGGPTRYTFTDTGITEGASYEYYVVPTELATGSGPDSNHASVLADARVVLDAVLSADPAGGLVPFTTELSATGSEALNCSIEGAEWDLDGDGVFGGSAAEQALSGQLGLLHEVTEPGSHTVAVELVNEFATTSRASITLHADHWYHSWGGDGNEYAEALVAAPDGSIYGTGRLSSFGAGGEDVLLFKYNPDGSRAWAYGWGGTDYDRGYGITLADDALYIVGLTQSYTQGSDDALVLKCSLDGTPQWAWSWGAVDGESSALPDSLAAVIPDGSGGVYAAGVTERWADIGGTPVKMGDVLLMHLAADGTLLDSFAYGAPEDNDYAHGLARQADGSLVIAGQSYQRAPGATFGLLTTVAADGTVQWAQRWGSDFETETLRDVALAPDGGIYVAGLSYSYGSGQADVLVQRYGAGGTLAWSTLWGGPLMDRGFGIALAAGGVYVGGDIQAADGLDTLLLRLSTAGNMEWARSWGNPVWDEYPPAEHALTLAVDGAGNAYLGGSGENASFTWQSGAGGATAETGAPVALTLGARTPTGSSMDITTAQLTDLSGLGVADSGGGYADMLVMKLGQ